MLIVDTSVIAPRMERFWLGPANLHRVQVLEDHTSDTSGSTCSLFLSRRISKHVIGW